MEELCKLAANYSFPNEIINNRRLANAAKLLRLFQEVKTCANNLY